MALFNYFNRIAKVPSTEKMETEIETKISEDTNGPKKRGEYLKFSEDNKVVIAKYASEHGVAKAVPCYASEHGTEVPLPVISQVRNGTSASQKQ